VYALHSIHSALVPNGLLVDTQPISAQPHVTANGAELGALDMSEWLETTHAVDARVNETIAAGLYELTDERELVVSSIFDDGPDRRAITGAWQGTRVPQPLADRLAVMRAGRSESARRQHSRRSLRSRPPTSLGSGAGFSPRIGSQQDR
jgi:hypothetical protein